jgi:hypothetical protein
MIKIIRHGVKPIIEVTTGPARFGKNKPKDCTCTQSYTCGACLQKTVERNKADAEKEEKRKKSVNETTIADHEDIHLQSAHDALSARISNHKREGKDASALEERLKKIKALIGKKD